MAGDAGHDELVELRTALARYEGSASSAALDQAFVAAGATVASLRGDRAAEPADATEVRELMAELPEFEQLVYRAVDEAERAAHAAATALWEWFGLRSAPPEWDDAERSGARVIVACACAPLQQRGAGWLRPRLLRLAATAMGEGAHRRARGKRRCGVAARARRALRIGPSSLCAAQPLAHPRAVRGAGERPEHG